MQTATALAILAYVATASAQGVTAIISAPGSTPSGAVTSENGAFGIQVVQIGTQQAKRQVVSQIGDGQIQRGTSTAARPVTQIGDGQIQAPTARPVTQIGDGQIQAPTARPVTQIGDGQIQAPTGAAQQRVTVTVTKNNCMASPITQISDGQIQAPMRATPVSQIGDGQIQAPAAATGTPVSQIRDGQIQAPAAATGTPVRQISDGQVQQRTTLATSVRPATSGSAGMLAVIPNAAQACASGGALTITLQNGILKDNQGRTGYIASNSQFQFDGPPQAGAIYTAGWSVVQNGSLALGGSTLFYQCLSGNFYNLYYRNVLNAAQCTPVNIEAIQLNQC
ncbi:hypothetical protein PYCC9005_001369 [Savitreella phatthalungensis]